MSIFNKLTKHISHAQMRHSFRLASILFALDLRPTAYICQASLLTDFRVRHARAQKFSELSIHPRGLGGP